MQKVGTFVFMFMLMVRVVASINVAIGAMGMLWFSNYYFSGENLFEMAIATTPLVCLIVGIFTPERLLLYGPRFWWYQGLFAVGIICVGFSMFGDLSLPNGPDYGALQLRFFSLGLLLIFIFRAAFVRSTTKSQPKSKEHDSN